MKTIHALDTNETHRFYLNGKNILTVIDCIGIDKRDMVSINGNSFKIINVIVYPESCEIDYHLEPWTI